MYQENYHCTISVNKPVEEAFEAVTNRISEWWSRNAQGSAHDLHDVFTVHFGKTYGTFKIVNLIPGKKIVWYTLDCYLDIFKDKELWKDSTLVWDFTPMEDGAEITMKHIGLFPGVECYEDCRLGWDFFIKESLFKLLTEDKGLPGVGIRARIINREKMYEGIMYSIEDLVPLIPDGSIVIDVKERVGEKVVAAHTISEYNKANFNLNNLKGSYFMILENEPSSDMAPLFTELQGLL